MLRNRRISETLLSVLVIASLSLLTGCGDKKDSGEASDASAKMAKEQASGQGNIIPVTREQITRLGIKISRAEIGSVSRDIRVTGEVKINSDRMAHVAPRAAGVVREVRKVLGDAVKANETLAWIESDELAEAKLDFYAKESEVGCCDIKLPQAKAIFENVAKLTALLRKEAPESDIRKLEALEMGKYRGGLLTSYAAYLAARTTHKRETSLHAEKISRGSDLLDAQTALKQTETKFKAIMDTVRYETFIAYTEAVQERQVAVFNAVAAEKRLRLKGADDKAVADLRKLVPKVANLKPCVCDDPDCEDGKLPSVAETLGKDGRFAWYELRTPFVGTVIAKHIVVGESIDKTVEVFTIANLSNVWIDLAISQDNISSVKEGYTVTVSLPDGEKSEGKVEFVSPIVAPDTRMALARVVLPNPDGLFRPGTFVDAAIAVPSNKDAVVIPKTAIQLVFDHPSVFVWGSGSFELREVVVGVTDGRRVEILNGLKAGESVASVNAFHLKAEYVKSRAGDVGAHHGHSH
jgi:cobalt-zinc-cadmium efflux system membrane fusion protein